MLGGFLRVNGFSIPIISFSIKSQIFRLLQTLHTAFDTLSTLQSRRNPLASLHALISTQPRRPSFRPPVSALGSLVRCPSVFSPSGWVDRNLTLPELMAAFDVPPQAHPKGRPGKGDKISADFCFVLTPPIKLLQRSLECWIPEVTPILYEEAEKRPRKTLSEPGKMYLQEGRESKPSLKCGMTEYGSKSPSVPSEKQHLQPGLAVDALSRLSANCVSIGGGEIF
jgi:hypothetical protein